MNDENIYDGEVNMPPSTNILGPAERWAKSGLYTRLSNPEWAPCERCDSFSMAPHKQGWWIFSAWVTKCEKCNFINYAAYD